MKLNSDLEILKKTDKVSYSDELFGIKKRVKVRHFSKKTELVPEIDKGYIFDEITTLSIIAGFNQKRVLIYSWHWKIYPYRTNCSTT